MTRNDARKLFEECRLDYSALNGNNLRRLRTLVNNAMIESGLIRGSFRCFQRFSKIEGVVQLNCRSDYFTDRPCITFNEGGFIGFAGWADDVNVQPILKAFAEWCRSLRGRLCHGTRCSAPAVFGERYCAACKSTKFYEMDVSHYLQHVGHLGRTRGNSHGENIHDTKEGDA